MRFRFRRSAATALIAGLVTFAAASPAAAQRAERAAPRSPTVVTTGGVIGGAAGLLAGSLVGFAIGGNRCIDPGNPDSCRGLEGAVVGAVIGHTVMIPIGAHVADARRGELAPSLLVSAGIAALGWGTILLLNQVDGSEAGQVRSGPASVGIALAVPVAQVVGAVVVERRRRR